MRIVQINSTCGVGSTGRIATDIAAEIARAGGECTIAYGRGEARVWDDVVKIGTKADHIVHGLQTRVLDRHGLSSVRATKQLIDKLRKLDPDLIHLHNIHGYYVNYEVLFDYLRDARRPVVWTLHDCWPFTGHCAHFELVGCERWRTGCGLCPQKHEYPSSWLRDGSAQNWLLKRQAFCAIPQFQLVTPSHWLANLAKQSFLTHYPVRVINNAVDTKVFHPRTSDFRQRLGLVGRYLILGVASGWPYGKGLHHLIDLAAMLREDETLIVVGVTEAQRRGLPPGVIAIPRTDSPIELAEIYTACDVFVNPTLEDTFSMTNLEAAACGTRVISYDSGGAGEAVDRDRDILLTDRTPAGLRWAIDEARLIGDQVRPAPRRQESMVAEYVQLYQELLGLRQ